MIRVAAAVLLAVELGAGFGSASATVETSNAESMVVDLRVEVEGSPDSVVAHLALPDEDTITISFLGGQIVSAESRQHRQENQIGKLLLRSGRLNDADLARALELQKDTRQRLGFLLRVHHVITQLDRVVLQLALRLGNVVHRLGERAHVHVARCLAGVGVQEASQHPARVFVEPGNAFSVDQPLHGGSVGLDLLQELLEGGITGAVPAALQAQLALMAACATEGDDDDDDDDGGVIIIGRDGP